MNLDDQEVMMIARIVARLKGMSPEKKEEWFRKSMELFVESEAKCGLDLPGDLLGPWETFYRDLFDLDLDFSSLRIPEKKGGFDRLIIVAKGMTPDKLYAKCQELFTCWKYRNNLDSVTSDRDSNKMGTYAIWVRDRVEADVELEGKSANMLAKEGVKGLTLPERLLYELKYFTETGLPVQGQTGKHLDLKNITLCSGSRYPVGGVPGVFWYSGFGKMCVDWYDPDYRYDYLRARAAVTL